MIPKSIIRLSMILSIVFGGIFASCSYEMDADVSLPGGRGDATVTFSLNVPGSSVPDTRALSEQDETNVETIDVLLFRNEGTERVYYDKVLGTSLKNSPGNTKSFEAAIPVMDYKNYDITVIANGRKEIINTELVVGESKSVTLNKLVKTIPTGEKWSSNTIPMWGESLNVTVDLNTNLTGENAVRMTRMISRIDVKLSKKAATGSDEKTATGNSNFELVSVRLYNYSTKGTLAPDLGGGWGIVGDADFPEATRPNEPGGGYGKALYGGSNEPLVYLSDDEHPTASDSLIRAIYTLEALKGSAETLETNTCLVIGGKYKGGEESYYRIDFATKNNDTQKYEYLHLLRNFRYTVNITEISGDGFGSPEEAFNSRPVNIEVDILDWNEAYLSDVVFDGQNYLSVTPGLFELYRDAREGGKHYGDNILYVKTDYTNKSTGANSGWYVEKIVDADNRDLEIGWLRLSLESGSPKQRNKPADEVELILDENKGAEARSAIIVIAAGRLRYEVEVKQSAIPDIMLKLVDSATDQPIKELIFSAPLGQHPERQEFRVDWRPQYSDLVVVNTAQTGIPFPIGYDGAPASGVIEAGNEGTGTITYSIRPEGFSADEVNEESGGNPFLEKTSKVDFTISNGVSYESKSIFLRQIHYNLLVDHEDNYSLNGSTYSINVRSNAAWRIKSVIEKQKPDENKQILKLKGSDNLRAGIGGGYEILGEAVTFTVANDRTLWGEVEVTFESTDYPKRFEDKTVTLIFALPKMKIMGIANTSHFGYNVAQPGDSEMSPYDMLNSANNFGITSTSTVFSQGFEFMPRTQSASDARVTEWLAEKPDIIVYGYNTGISVNQAKMYAEYVKNGGVFIAFFEFSASTDLIDAMFDITGTKRTGAGGAGTNHLITDAIDDLITNGYFGDVRGKYWGEDASTTESVTIPDGAIVYSTRDSYATALRHPELGFIFIGDGGFCSSNTTASGGTACPFKLDKELRPVPRPSYGGGRNDVYNSAVFGNIIAWAMMKTTINGN